MEEFKSKFGNLVPFNLINKNLSGSEDYQTIRKMFSTLINKIINERNRNGENIVFHQLFHLLYQENRGAKMYTFGGVITESDKTFESLNLSDFEFIKNEDYEYKIDIPNLTIKEIELINKNLFETANLQDFIERKIVTEREIEKYNSTYKYLPNYFDVRM